MAARLGRLLASLAALAGAARVLAWGTAAPAAATQRGEATFDDLLGLAAAAAGWLVLGWLVAVLACTALAAAPGTIGRAGASIGLRIAPATARRLAAVAIGLSIAAGPAAACSTGPDGLAASAAEPVAAERFDPSTLPSVGRPGELVPPGIEAVGSAEGDARVAAVPTASSTSPPSPPVAGEGAVTATAGLAVEPSREHSPGTAEVVVHRGDSLWTIAARHLGPDATDADIAAEWPRWHAANRDTVGDDPDLILPGMILHPPAR
jgi:nucleoid-associated protein YgaU